jgi:hypothetical protein
MRRTKKVLNSWIRDFIPEDMPFGEVEKLAKAAQISPGTLRQIRKRESVSADTILSILLARGVPEEALMNLPQSEAAAFSRSLSEWNRLGNTLSDGQRENIIKLVKVLLGDWKLR